MSDEKLRLVAELQNKASAELRKLSKDMSGIKPNNGMLAARKWFDEFRGAGDKAAASLKPLPGMFSALGVGGIAAGLSLGEMVKQFRELADSTATMKELGRQSGMTTTEIARLQYAASKLHVDPGKVSGAINTWSGKMVEFRRHTGRFYTELLRQNSDLAHKIASEDPAQGFRDTLDFLARIPAAAQKAGMSAADAAQIQKRWTEEALGDGDIAQMLSKGPQGLADAYAEAARNVKPITPELERQADALNQSLARFDQTWSNFKREVGPTVLNGLSETVDKLDRVFKLVQAHPAETAIGAGSAAALYARHRMMRGSSLAGGIGLSRAAGELTGSATALKQAAAAIEGSKAPGGPAEPGKPGGSFDKGRALLAAAGLAGVVANAPGMDEAGDRERDANASALESLGEKLKEWTGASWLQAHNPFGGGSGGQPAAARELSEKVQEGSKAGIIAGLREMAQQQELEGGKSVNAGGGKMLGRGAANLRYGRRGGSGAYRGTPVPDAPYNGKNIDGLSEGASKQYASILGNRESGNRYGITNSYGYAGRWQFGASALAENGYVRPGTTNAGLRSPGNWTGKGGVGSLTDWLANKNGSQDQALGEYTNRHYAQLKAAGVIRPGMSPSEIAGWLAAAHLKGVGGAIALSRGHDNVDGNGTSASSYRRMMQGVGAGASAGPSAAATSAADAFKARARALSGSAPQAHASGGAIRGPGGPRSDSIFAMLSNGEFVVNARDAKRHAPLLQAINSGGLPAFADGGLVAGRSRRNAWLSFFQRSVKDGGMGAARHVAFGATAMMMGESGRNLDPSLYGWDVNGPSGGTAQWHDVTKGPGAGKLHRLSDLMTMAMQQHADWHDVPVQQAWWKREAQGPMAYAWNAMRRAKTAAGALKAGIDRFEVPANKGLELQRRLPNIMRLARETSGGPARVAHQLDPIEVNIRHHGNGRATVSGRAGKGVKIGIRSGPTMQPS